MQVLIIDDDNFEVKVMTHALMKVSDVTVHRAPDGESGFRYIQSHKPQLILLDLILAGWSGLKTLEAIRKAPEHRHIPVVVMSTSDAQSDVSASYELGANAYVVKPDHLEHYEQFALRLVQFWQLVTCA